MLAERVDVVEAALKAQEDQTKQHQAYLQNLHDAKPEDAQTLTGCFKYLNEELNPTEQKKADKDEKYLDLLRAGKGKNIEAPDDAAGSGEMNPGHGQERRFNFTKFDAESTDFDLLIHPAKKLQFSSGESADIVTGSIQSWPG